MWAREYQQQQQQQQQQQKKKIVVFRTKSFDWRGTNYIL